MEVDKEKYDYNFSSPVNFGESQIESAKPWHDIYRVLCVYRWNFFYLTRSLKVVQSVHALGKSFVLYLLLFSDSSEYMETSLFSVIRYAAGFFNGFEARMIYLYVMVLNGLLWRDAGFWVCVGLNILYMYLMCICEKNSLLLYICLSIRPFWTMILQLVGFG